MKFTKLEHSGCIIENNGKKLVCDPVEIEQKLPEISNVVAIVITHKHSDHFQIKNIESILDNNPKARIFVPEDFEVFEISGRPIEKVAAGAEWNMEDFNLKFFGNNHAEVIPGQVPCANIGVVINDTIVNPGDSFNRPTDTKKPKLLLVPSAAPWLKIYESIEYTRAMQPEIIVPVHNAVLSDFGSIVSNNCLKMICNETGVVMMALRTGESMDI